MDDQLTREIRRRVEADASLDDRTTAMITAACTGHPLDDAGTATWPDTTDPTTEREQSQGVFLQGITVEGFRGIGPRRRLDLTPGPGLTLVVGRNGSGKSSFAEGLEMCLTGSSTRWEGRTKVWQESWRNLHQPTPAAVAAELVGIDATPRTLTHAWADDQALPDATSTLDDGRTLDDLGWTTALAQYRPMLSFNEMGAMFDEPKQMYDAIAEILGVQDVRDAVERLRQARLDDEKPIKTVKRSLPSLIDDLRASDDPRAADVLAALDGRTWDLAAAQAATEEDTTTPTSDMARLRSLATLSTPHPLTAAEAATALRDAAAQHRAAASTDAGRASRLATLLTQAIACVDHDGPTPCPLCGSGTVLGEGWVADARQEAAALTAQASAVATAETAMTRARTAARQVTPPRPEVLDVASFVDLDATAVSDAWTALLDAPTDADALADHLEERTTALATAAEQLRQQATTALDQRQDDWRPLAHAITRFVTDARAALAAQQRARQAKVAEGWLADVASAIEAERFEPIADAVRDYWGRLRLASNVALDGVTMKRAGSQRSLQLDVTVDDTGASALGVMSQGELHALALSVFLPRATMDDSPFRFLVLDDPVQAMDPSRVDGLAEVLAEVARTRQVVVMTHDARLPEAVRRLQIPATVWEVHRRTRSQVDLRTVDDPISRYLADARAIARAGDLPPKVRAQLIAQMGRGAVEAACIEVVRARRLARGEDHHAVEQALETAGLQNKLALAMFDDAGRSADVPAALGKGFDGYTSVFFELKEGAHTGERRTDDDTFVRHLEGLLRHVRAQGAAA